MTIRSLILSIQNLGITPNTRYFSKYSMYNTLIVFHVSPTLHHASCVGDTPMTSISDRFYVLVKSTLARLERRRDPRFPAFLQFLGRYTELDGILDRIHGDDIAVLDQCDRPTDLGFWDDVPDTESVGSRMRMIMVMRCVSRFMARKRNQKKKQEQERDDANANARKGINHIPSTKPSVSDTGYIHA